MERYITKNSILTLTPDLMNPGLRNVGNGTVGQNIDAGRERTSTRGCSNDVLQYHVPTNDEGHEFSHCDVAVDIG